MCPVHQDKTAPLPTQPSAGEGSLTIWIERTPRGLTFAADSHHHDANHPETKTQDRRKDILAFRTIMHSIKAFMLDVRVNVNHIYTHSKSEEKELQLSSAFASLAVLNHEIIAVVVASQTVTQEGSRLSGVFTENPRFDDRKTSAASEPILLTPDVPRQFKEFEEEMKKRGGFDDANILNQYIDKVLYSQG
jgi:hypothetical protein